MTQYTEEDTATIYYGDHPDFDPSPVHVEIGDKHRWSIESTHVFRHTATGDHYAVTMLIADEASNDGNEPAGPPVKVQAVERTVIVWEPIKP